MYFTFKKVKLEFQDANVFLGGEPGSRLSVGGFQGCLFSLEVFIAEDKMETPNWEEATLVNFHERDSLTVFYGEHTCGVCKMRDLEPVEQHQPSVPSFTPSTDNVDTGVINSEQSTEEMDEDDPTEEGSHDGSMDDDQFPDWEVSELPSQMIPWTSVPVGGDYNPTVVVTYDNTPTVVTYDNSPLFSYKPASPEGTTVRNMKEISDIISTLPTTTTRETTKSITTTTTPTTTTTTTTTSTSTTITPATTETNQHITATNVTATIVVMTTKLSSTSGKTTKSSVIEALPEKQKCEAEKVYLDGTGWLELTRKVSFDMFQPFIDFSYRFFHTSRT